MSLAGDLRELGSLHDPLEDHDIAIPNETAREEEPGVRSTELHHPDLF